MRQAPQRLPVMLPRCVPAQRRMCRALDPYVSSKLVPKADLHDATGLECDMAGSGSDACSAPASAGCRSRLGLHARALARARGACVMAAAGGGQARAARPCAAGLGEVLKAAAKQGMLVVDPGFGAGQQSMPDLDPAKGAAELSIPGCGPGAVGDGVYVCSAQPRTMESAAPVAAVKQGGARVNPGFDSEPWAPANAAAEEGSPASDEQRETAHGGSSCSGMPTGCSQPMAAPEAAALGTEIGASAELTRQRCSADSGSSCSSGSTSASQLASAFAAPGLDTTISTRPTRQRGETDCGRASTSSGLLVRALQTAGPFTGAAGGAELSKQGGVAECAVGGSSACLQQRTPLAAAAPGAGTCSSAERGLQGAAAGGSSCSGGAIACFQRVAPPVVTGPGTDRSTELTGQSGLAECGSSCSGKSVACTQQVAPAVVGGSGAPPTAGPCPMHSCEEGFCLPVPGLEFLYLDHCGSEPLPLPAKAASPLACSNPLRHGQDDDAPGCSAGCTAIDPTPDPSRLATASSEGRPAGSDQLHAGLESLGTLTQPAGPQRTSLGMREGGNVGESLGALPLHTEPRRTSLGMRNGGNVGETLGALIPQSELRRTSTGLQEGQVPGTWADLACALRDSGSSCSSSDAGAACGVAGSEPACVQLPSLARAHSALSDSRCSTSSTDAGGQDHAACLEPARLRSVGPANVHACLRSSHAPLRRTAHELDDEPHWAQGQGQGQGRGRGQGQGQGQDPCQGRSAPQLRSCSLVAGGAQNPELASGREAGGLPGGLSAPAGAEAGADCPHPGPNPSRAQNGLGPLAAQVGLITAGDGGAKAGLTFERGSGGRENWAARGAGVQTPTLEN